MGWRTTFGNLAAGDQSLSLFDTQFNDMGLLTIVPCTASGTNVIALTPQGFTAAQTACVNYQRFGFVAANTSTGSVSVNVAAIGALNLYLPDGVTQAASGNITAGAYYDIVYNLALNGGAGGFQIVGVSSATVPVLSKITNSLGGDVALNNVSNFFDGPSVAQGSVGIWFASGTVTVNDTAAASTFKAKLWDGTTLIASSTWTTLGANTPMTSSLSGFLATPAGNLRISVNDGLTTGKILFNNSGLSKDSTISAIRIG